MQKPLRATLGALMRRAAPRTWGGGPLSVEEVASALDIPLLQQLGPLVQTDPDRFVATALQASAPCQVRGLMPGPPLAAVQLMRHLGDLLGLY